MSLNFKIVRIFIFYQITLRMTKSKRVARTNVTKRSLIKMYV